jgi:hypothetical protein
MMPSFVNKRGRLQPAWRYRAEGMMWRIVVTPRGRLAGEVRDAKKLTVHFFCVDGRSGTVLWQHATFGEQWWMGIEALCGETLLLHKYTTPSMPEHRGIIAVEIESGKELWRDEDMRFECCLHESIVASRSTVLGKQIEERDARTGSLVRTFSEAEAEDVCRASSFERTTIEMPAAMADPAADPSANAAVLRSQCDTATLVGPVGYLERDGLLIFAYHQPSTSSEGRVQTTLTILDRGTNAVLFSERVQQSASTLPAEIFFVWQNMLYYLEEQTTLIAINLAKQVQ